MFQLIFKIWWMIALMPLFIFQEGNQLLVRFFKKRNIYWDFWYSLLLVFVIMLIVLLVTGHR